LSYSVGEQFLNNLPALGILVGRKHLCESLLSESLFSVKEALGIAGFMQFFLL